jgi:hypothetical protein
LIACVAGDRDESSDDKKLLAEHRLQAVLEVQKGSPVAKVAARYGASRQSVYGWKARYERDGIDGLADNGANRSAVKRWAAWPRGIRWLIGGIAVVLLAVAVSWVLVVPAADWLARHDVGSGRAPLLQTARDAARGRLLTLGAGLFAAAALLFTARNFTLSREGQVTDRYTKAVEQLGSDKLVYGVFPAQPGRRASGQRCALVARRQGAG